MVLDGGVIAPYVETVAQAQAQALRGALKLRPIKGERLAAALRDVTTLEPELRAYFEGRNRDSLFIINIDSAPALARLDELLAVLDLDAVLSGPHDLWCSLCIPKRYNDPRFEVAVLTIIPRAGAAGESSGIHWWGPLERFDSWIKAGLNLIISNGDISAMQAKLGADIMALRRASGDGVLAGGRGLIRFACRRRTS